MSGVSARTGEASATSHRRWLPNQFSTFEKVIVANSAIILLDTLAGWWITQHNPETYHYLIDTAFIALAALLGLVVNFSLLRAAFAPLHGVLATIRAVEEGNLEARAEARESDADALALARAFNAMLDQLELARHEAAARALAAQEEERRRLALELHDETAQSLTALALHAEAIARRLSGEQSAAAAQAGAQAEHLAALAQRTLTEVQALARQLRPPALDDLGLHAALRWLADDTGERLGVRVCMYVREAGRRDGDDYGDDAARAAGQLRAGDRPASETPTGEPGRLPGEMETALYRIAQESLTNAVRHGRARSVNIVLWRMPAAIKLLVVDDGCGFDGGAGGRVSGRGRGMGLEGMAERARLLGGSLRVRSQPGRGCAVRAALPLDRCVTSTLARHPEYASATLTDCSGDMAAAHGQEPLPPGDEGGV